MAHLQPLDSTAEAVMPVLIRAMALGDILCPDDERIPERPPPEMGLLLSAGTRELEPEVRSAASAVLARTLGRPDAPSADAVGGMAARLHGRLDALWAELGIGDDDLDPDASEELIQPLGELFRELGLEQFDTSLVLGRSREGVLQVGWSPVDPLTADVWQLGRLFERTSLIIQAHPLLGFERMASDWWLSTFRHKRFDDEFTGRVREQEWSLADRETLLFRGSPLRLLLDSELAGSVPARQRKLAEGVLSSLPGVFLVVERGGDHLTVLEDLSRGRRFQVHEHNDESDYGAGCLAFGRLYRVDRGTYLRSPGMAFVPPEDGLAETLRRAVRASPPDFPPAAQIENLLGAVLGGSTKPRRILPARNPSEAGDLLRALVDHLEEGGLAHEASEDEVEVDPEWASGVDPSNLAYRRFEVDVAVGGWMSALMEQARRRGSAGDPKRRGGGRKKDAGPRKARRKKRRS